VAFRGIAEIDRRVAFEDDEQLLLDVLGVALPSGTWRIAPEARP